MSKQLIFVYEVMFIEYEYNFFSFWIFQKSFWTSTFCIPISFIHRFLCGTVNEFVAEVGKAYERATENKEEADAMAKKVKLETFFFFQLLWANS